MGSSASNGVAERGVQAVEGQVRVLKDALEMRLETETPSNHYILAWLVEFAGTVVNPYEVGCDGKTPYERLRGKQSRLIGLEFGGKANFWRTAVGARMAKLDSLWSDGVFLGYRSISGEVFIGTRTACSRRGLSSAKRMSTAGGKEIWIWLEEYRGKHHQTEAKSRPSCRQSTLGWRCQKWRFPASRQKIKDQSLADSTLRPETSRDTVPL